MADKKCFSWFDLVRCDGEIYAVVDDNRVHSKGILGVVSEDQVRAGMPVYEDQKNTIWLPMSKVERLDAVRVDSDTVRSLFRLDKTPWELATEGKCPISYNSERYVPTIEDIVFATERLIAADDVSFEAWTVLFLSPERPLNVTGMNESARIMECILWYTMQEIDRGEPEDRERLELLHSQFADNVHTPLRDWHIDERTDSSLFGAVEDLTKERSISDDLRALYTRVLDDESGTDESWRCYYRAYAYYGGNRVVNCNWYKSEQALLKAYTLCESSDKAGIANSLGYIYGSNRLGEPDYDKAFHYFTEAAEAGNREAIYKLSDLYRLGRGTAADGPKALSLLKPLYEQELTDHRSGHYGSKLADTALRMGYCARDGIGRERNLRDAYCLFMQAKNAILVRRAKKDHFGDGTVEANIDRALSELADVYSPESESYVGLIGKTDEGRLQRCMADDGDVLLLRSVNDRTLETRMPRQRFSPITEHAHDAGDTVTIIKGHKLAVVRSASWHFNRGTMSYLLTIDGKESGKWYFDGELENE